MNKLLELNNAGTVDVRYLCKQRDKRKSFEAMWRICVFHRDPPWLQSLRHCQPDWSYSQHKEDKRRKTKRRQYITGTHWRWYIEFPASKQEDFLIWKWGVICPTWVNIVSNAPLLRHVVVTFMKKATRLYSMPRARLTKHPTLLSK